MGAVRSHSIRICTIMGSPVFSFSFSCTDFFPHRSLSCTIIVLDYQFGIFAENGSKPKYRKWELMGTYVSADEDGKCPIGIDILEKIKKNKIPIQVGVIDFFMNRYSCLSDLSFCFTRAVGTGGHRGACPPNIWSCQ